MKQAASATWRHVTQERALDNNRCENFKCLKSALHYGLSNRTNTPDKDAKIHPITNIFVPFPWENNLVTGKKKIYKQLIHIAVDL
jgi:hypothetical protein